MVSEYDIQENEIVRNMREQRNIHKFRYFMYSRHKDLRQHRFRITKEFLDNEYKNNSTLTATERELLLNLKNHWDWSMFDNDSTNWWSTLSVNYSRSLSLMTVIHMWIDGINTFDTELSDTFNTKCII
jgi:hypothetical protein